MRALLGRVFPDVSGDVLMVFTHNVDTFTNPFLVRFFEETKARNIRVLLFSPFWDKNFAPKNSNMELIEFPVTLKRLLYNAIKSPMSYWRTFILTIRNRSAVVIGIDPGGFVRAARVGRYWKARLGYFSFEIVFQKESSPSRMNRIKKAEISYSACADFVVIQDARRRALLEQEGRFSSECKFFQIPVAPSGITPNSVNGKKKRRKELSLPVDRILMIHSGDVAAWTGIDRLLDLIESGRNDNYWLVVHSKRRLTETDTYRKRIEYLQSRGRPVSLHNQPYTNNDDYFQFLSAFDIGIALYFPNDFEGEYVSGLNIEEIGLSSGKFNTYMMLGIPSIVRANGIFPSLREEYDFGGTISDVSDLMSAADEIVSKYDTKRDNCLRLYDEVLRPDERVKGLVDEIVEYSQAVKSP
jgi:hypothetical protein